MAVMPNPMPTGNEGCDGCKECWVGLWVWFWVAVFMGLDFWGFGWESRELLAWIGVGS